MNEVNNNVTAQKKEAVTKSLAIVGFVALIVFGVWLSVQIVRVIPGAFSSLASIADGVYSNRPIDTLTVATEKSIINAGEAFTISWTDVSREGEYNFSYACTEGVSLDIRTSVSNVEGVLCDQPFILPADSYEIDVIIASEKRRFIDVPFTLSFTQVHTEEALFEKLSKVTVVNATIPQSADLVTEDVEAEVVATDEEVVEDTVDDTESEVTPTTPAVTPTPTVTEQVISIIPTSDPNGFVDLKITYLGVGTLSGSTFVPTGTIDNDERGSMRFEVKNIGSKTSDEWTFTAKLPSGFMFESETQAPLKPNERATITLGFDVTDQTGNKDIKGSVDVDNDVNTANNAFAWSVQVVE